MIEIVVRGSASPALLQDIAGVLGEFPGDHEAEVGIVMSPPVGDGVTDDTEAVQAVFDGYRPGEIVRRVTLGERYMAVPVVLGMVRALDGVVSVRVVVGR